MFRVIKVQAYNGIIAKKMESPTWGVALYGLRFRATIDTTNPSTLKRIRSCTPKPKSVGLT